MTLWPAVVDRLLVVLPTLTGWSGVTVTDGRSTSREGATVLCTVGHAKDVESAGTVELVTDPEVTALWSEVGSVQCELVAGAGESTPAVLRAQVFGLLDPLATYLRDDPSLGGVLTGAPTCSLLVDVLTGSTGPRGTVVRLPFQVAYTART